MGAQENQSSQESINGSADAAPVANYKDSSYKRNEDKKIFVGGIPYDVTNEDLIAYFSRFGEVTQAQVKFDWTTGRSRGFAFVEFATCETCKSALTEREQLIKNKQCEVKPAKSREVEFEHNCCPDVCVHVCLKKKVFVGGLPADHPEEELRKHFEQYGKVEDIEWPFDKQTRARRNFAFIVFEEEEAADRAAAISKQTFGSRECDVKKAVPQSKRTTNFMPRGGVPAQVGNIRGVYGTNAQWFANGWPQALNGVPAAYAAAAGTAAAATTGNWNDWYNNAATMANFYATNGTPNAATFPAAAYATNGYDYNQAAAAAVAASGAPGAGVGGVPGGIRMNRQMPPQNGTAVGAQRY